MAINISELVTSTLRNQEGAVADNVTKHNALLFALEENGGIKNAGGGRDLTENLIYAELASKFYDGYETFTIDTSQEVLDAAVYQWKQLGGFSFISGRDKIMNREKWQAVSLVESRSKALIAGLRNKAGQSLYSLGTGDGGKEFTGLRALVSDDGEGTVGGIPAGTGAGEYAWWMNQFDAVNGAIDQATLLTRMNAMQLATTRGTDQANLIMADGDMFSNYWALLQENARHTSAKMADAGFRTLEFVGTPVVYDAQAATDLTAANRGRMYFLNTDYLHFQKAPERFFTTEDYRKVENADYDVIPNWTMGNLTCSNRSLQGVIVNNGT